MTKLALTTIAAAFALATAAPAFAAMDETACDATFVKFDQNGNGTLEGGEVGTFMATMPADQAAGMDQNASWTKEQFIAECTKGTFDAMKTQ